MVSIFFHLHGKCAFLHTLFLVWICSRALRSVVFQAIFIPIGICNGGAYSKGPRGKDKNLDAACTQLCKNRGAGYEDGKCPNSGGFRGGGADCPPECIREMSPVGVGVGSAIEVMIMVGLGLIHIVCASLADGVTTTGLPGIYYLERVAAVQGLQ